MSLQISDERPGEDEIAAVTQATQLWNQGAPPSALEQIRPFADRGLPWAVALSAWMAMQQGAPMLADGVRYAKIAADKGMPWIAAQVFNNGMGQLPNSPEMLDDLLELGATVIPWAGGIDPVGQGWNLVVQGHPGEGIRLMGASFPHPLIPNQWESVVSEASARLSELREVVSNATGEQARVRDVAERVVDEISKYREDVETSAKQANLLVTTVTSDAINSRFEKDAERNAGESRVSWGFGLLVLGMAAVVAVLPLALHYLDRGPNYSTTALLGAHLASTGALASFAGVLLARGRARDLAAQRSRDLSTAMGTMIGYSNQISNPEEKERFMMTMGQLVLQAHLTGGGTAGSDESMSGAVALASLIRQPSPRTGAAPES